MYYVRKNSKILFLIFDLIALSLGYYLSFNNIYKTEYNFHFFIMLIFVAIFLSLFTEEYWEIADRGYLLEFKFTFLYILKLLSIFVCFLVVIEKINTVVFGIGISLFFITLFFCFYVARCFAKILNKRFVNDNRNILILSKFEYVREIENNLPKNYKVVGYISKEDRKYYNDLPVIHSVGEIKEFISVQQIDEIYTNVDEVNNFYEIFKFFEVVGITTKINITPLLPNVSNNTIVTFQEKNVYLTSAIKIATFRQLILKRIMDIVLALGGIVLTFVVAIIIKPKISKQSPGPLLFKQVRVGENGKRFEIYKFRSMYVDAEERKKEFLEQNDLETTLMFKLKDDPRVFPFGQKLRDWSLDELPQFINVLKGEMSVVGTRPPTVDEYESYELHHFKRLSVKPGITGLWQVSGRSNIKDFEEVVKLDMEYIENWSLRLDIKIIFRTIMVVLKREGSR